VKSINYACEAISALVGCSLAGTPPPTRQGLLVGTGCPVSSRPGWGFLADSSLPSRAPASRGRLPAEPVQSIPFSRVVFRQMPKAEAKAHNMPITLASKPQVIVHSCWQMKPCSKHLIP